MLKPHYTPFSVSRTTLETIQKERFVVPAALARLNLKFHSKHHTQPISPLNFEQRKENSPFKDAIAVLSNPDFDYAIYSASLDPEITLISVLQFNAEEIEKNLNAPIKWEETALYAVLWLDMDTVVLFASMDENTPRDIFLSAIVPAARIYLSLANVLLTAEDISKIKINGDKKQRGLENILTKLYYEANGVKKAFTLAEVIYAVCKKKTSLTMAEKGQRFIFQQAVAIAHEKAKAGQFVDAQEAGSVQGCTCGVHGGTSDMRSLPIPSNRRASQKRKGSLVI